MPTIKVEQKKFLPEQRRRALIFLATIIFVVLGTVFTIRYAKGYRPTMKGALRETGLLAVNSFPTGAEVYINDRLTTATDNTLNLNPGEYAISIRKDGYHNWNKKIIVQAELVTQTNAQLFPTSPSLEPVTYTGAINPIPAPDGNKLVFAVASASATAKNGLYVQDLATSPISLGKSGRQIARTSTDFDFTKAQYTWAPSGTEILVSFPTGSNLLLSATSFNDLNTYKDVTVTLPQTFRDWEEEIARSDRIHLVKLPDFMTQVATASATNLYFSPDGDRLLYQSTTDLEIPQNLIPPIPASSTQTEDRNLKTNSWYIYDLKEDKNFFVAEGTIIPKVTPLPFTPSKLPLLDNFSSITPAELGQASPSAFRKLQTDRTIPETIALLNAQYSPISITNVQWYPDSAHIIITKPSSIEIGEYDGTNKNTIYAGPFDSGIVYPWPDGSKLITRIQFSPDTIPNLYTIKLK